MYHVCRQNSRSTPQCASLVGKRGEKILRGTLFGRVVRRIAVTRGLPQAQHTDARTDTDNTEGGRGSCATTQRRTRTTVRYESGKVELNINIKKKKTRRSRLGGKQIERKVDMCVCTACMARHVDRPFLVGYCVVHMDECSGSFKG